MNEKSSASDNRNPGIDALRIAAMVSIMILHVLGYGGVLKNLRPLSPGYEAAWFLEVIVFFGVTVYALISGYVGVDRRFHISNIVYVWLQVVFYTILITLVFAVFFPGSVNARSILNVIFPVMTEQYWYFSAYFGVFFFIPMLNHAVVTIYKKYLNIMLVAFIVMFSVFPVFFSTDVYGIRRGYSFIWLLACYFIGAYIKQYGVFEKTSTAILWALFALSVVLTWGFKFALEVILRYTKYEDGRSNMLIEYNSPTILICAVMLLVIFSRYKPKSENVKKVICRVSPLCFGVYLLTTHPLVWNRFVKDGFSRYAKYPLPVMLTSVILGALFMFLLGIAVDSLRFLLFEITGLRAKMRIMEDKLFDKRN